MMKLEIVAYLHVVVDDVKIVDPASFRDFMDNTYISAIPSNKALFAFSWVIS